MIRFCSLSKWSFSALFRVRFQNISFDIKMLYRMWKTSKKQSLSKKSKVWMFMLFLKKISQKMSNIAFLINYQKHISIFQLKDLLKLIYIIKKVNERQTWKIPVTEASTSKVRTKWKKKENSLESVFKITITHIPRHVTTSHLNHNFTK